MVGFDKGARVPRLADGAVLDGRQLAILLSQLRPGEREAEIVDWDRRKSPAMNERFETMLRTKGPRDKSVLLFALSTDLLRLLRYEDRLSGTTVDLAGDRGAGYTVGTDVSP